MNLRAEKTGGHRGPLLLTLILVATVFGVRVFFGTSAAAFTSPGGSPGQEITLVQIAADSPTVLTGGPTNFTMISDITISEGDTLTIAAGVIVRVQPGALARLNIRGALISTAHRARRSSFMVTETRTTGAESFSTTRAAGRARRISRSAMP